MNADLRQGFRALDDDDPESALRIAEHRLRESGDDVDALALSAAAHGRRGDDRRMAECHARILQVAPRTAASYVALADLFERFGRTERLDELLRQGIRWCPDSVELHCRMGKHLSALNRLTGGEWHFRRALALDEHHVNSLAGLALNLLNQGRIDEADARYADAHAADASDADVLAHWAHVAERRGDVDTARSRLEQAGAGGGQYDLLLASVHARAGKVDQALAAIGNSDAINGDALLARGRLQERRGDYDAAWNDYTAGKAKLAAAERVPDYDPAAVADLFARLRALATPALLAELPAADVRDALPQPLFICGAPRSGTTLIEQVLAAHPEVRAGGELTFVGEFKQLLDGLLPGASFPDNVALAAAGDRRYVASLLRDYYFARAAEHGLCNAGHGIFTDKMPWNETWLPLIRMAFPRAPVVRVERRAADTALSILANKLNHGFYCGYRIESIARHLSATRTLYRHYRDIAGLEAFDLDYEAFVADPGTGTRELLEIAGLPFDDACLEFHRGVRYAATPSYAQVAEPVNERSVGRSRHFERQLAPFASMLANGAGRPGGQ